MKNETYALRLLTPCFNGGATPRQTAELRVPSIRGQIRWWYRLACPQGDEQRLFGGVRGQAVRSSVIFRISDPDSFPDGRRIASDTVDGRSDLLGGIKPKRIPSPIKFKMIELSAEPHLLMFSPKPGLWDQALDHLQNHRNASPKPLTQLDWETIL